MQLVMVLFMFSTLGVSKTEELLGTAVFFLLDHFLLSGNGHGQAALLQGMSSLGLGGLLLDDSVADPLAINDALSDGTVNDISGWWGRLFRLMQ